MRSRHRRALFTILGSATGGMRILFAVTLAVVGLSDSTRATAAERVHRDLLVLYTFGKPSDGLILDRAETGEPLNLRVESSQGATFRSGRMLISSSVRIVSVEPARKIVTAVSRSKALSIEAWVKPQNVRQAGPARIVSLSADPGQRNFTLGQDAGRYDVRLRTSATDVNGIPSTLGPDSRLQPEMSHVVYTIDPEGSARIYVNGKEIATRPNAGQLTNWSEDFRLSLANELTGDRPWLGEFGLVALYGRSLSPDEVLQNFRAGIPTPPKKLPPPGRERVDFVKDVQPLLRRKCFECHSAGNEEGGLNLGVRQRVREGGDHGPVLTPGNSSNSLLIDLVAAVEPKEVMPPDGDLLTAEEVGLLRAWIDQGAEWPDGADILDPRTEQARRHWAFQPLQETPVPAVQDGSWPQTAIDRFILNRLETAGIKPQRRAGAREQIRRIKFDLVGLPPSPDEVHEFEAAFASDPQKSLNQLIDRLLESPHYGERWGRHWLDVARYADSDGQESDADRPGAYQYRDFVIRAFNDDLPFDQFVRWQLAGDEYEPENPSAIAATGFLAAGPFAALPDRLMEDERLRNRYNELDDVLSTIGTGLLGLTLGCARCHDHKYDAIPARDYYRLMSAFHGGQRAEVPLGGSNEKALVYRDLGPEPAPTWLFQRGDYYDRDQPLQLGFVFILTKDTSPEDYWKRARQESPAKGSSNQRRALADWISDVPQGSGALLARVIVNRLWQHHFGQALVRTVGDFGVRSEPPSHPELLEWLARDLVQNGWRLKRLQRMILQSAVYQQSGSASDVPANDVDNRLLWKFPLQRLEGEILRDSLLSVSGTLNLKSYGPAVKPPISGEAMLARNLKDPYPDKVSDGPDVRRRSIYLFHKRVVPYPLLQAFDKPDAQQSCGRRDNTTVAPQALALLNDAFVRQLSIEFADRLLKEVGADPGTCINRAYELALSRLPSDRERQAGLAFLEAQSQERRKREGDKSDEEIRRLALADFCQAVFSLNEFLYVD